MLINKWGRTKGNKKPLLEHNGNNYYRPDPLMKAKISEWNYREKKDICIASEYLPHKTY